MLLSSDTWPGLLRVGSTRTKLLLFRRKLFRAPISVADHHRREDETMSHWGKCTGFDYSNERVGFLNQHIASQRRIAAQGAARPLGFTGTRSVQLGTSIGAPLGTPRALRPLGPLPQPLQRDDLYTRGPLQTALLSRSARSLGQLAPSINEPPYRGQQSCSHLAYCRPTSAFRRTFGAIDRTNGKSRDDTTQFREQVYNVWNISGEKYPAGFRP